MPAALFSPRRCISSSGGGDGGGSKAGSTFDDDDDDAAGEIGDHHPYVRAFAKKASLLETESGRIAHVLFHKPQLLKVTRAWSILPPATGSLTAPFPRGADSALVQLVRFVFVNKDGATSKGSDEAETATSIALHLEDVQSQRIRSMAQLYKMPFRRRLRVAGCRNFIYMFLYSALNVVTAVRHACTSLVAFPCRARIEGTSMPLAVLRGFKFCGLYLVYGFAVSPVIIVPSGLLNTVFALANGAVGSKFSYDGGSGRYSRPTVAELRVVGPALEEELAVILGVGKADFSRAKLSKDASLQRMLHSTGVKMFSKAKKRRPDIFSKYKLPGDDDDDSAVKEDLYDILQLKRSATKDQIKQQYKKLAKLFHPDVVGAHSASMSPADKAKVEHKFESITEAFKTLSDAEKKHAYDIGGHQGLKMQQSRLVNPNSFLRRGLGGPGSDDGDALSMIFGGTVFRDRLIGVFAPTHYHCRYYLGCNISLQEFEGLQSLRMKLLALELAKMVDVHALAGSTPEAAAAAPDATTGTAKKAAPSTSKVSMPGGSSSSSAYGSFAGSSSAAAKKQPPPRKDDTLPTGAPSVKPMPASIAGAAVAALSTIGPPNEHCNFSPEFKARCEAFTDYLAEVCFGRELMFCVGEAYVVMARRFLGLVPWMQFENITYKKSFTGLIKQYRAQNAKMDPTTMQAFQQRVACEYFSIEFDAVTIDAYFAIRQAATLVFSDPGVSAEVLAKRKYATWYLGEMMMRKGLPFGQRALNDIDLQVYLVQASSATRNVAQPPPF